MDISTAVLLLLGAVGGAVVQAATGFGFAIVAAPVFLAAMNSHAVMGPVFIDPIVGHFALQ